MRWKPLIEWVLFAFFEGGSGVLIQTSPDIAWSLINIGISGFALLKISEYYDTWILKYRGTPDISAVSFVRTKEVFSDTQTISIIKGEAKTNHALNIDNITTLVLTGQDDDSVELSQTQDPVIHHENPVLDKDYKLHGRITKFSTDSENGKGAEVKYLTSMTTKAVYIFNFTDGSKQFVREGNRGFDVKLNSARLGVGVNKENQYEFSIEGIPILCQLVNTHP